MLTITIKGDELFDERTAEFFSVDDVVLDLEHSLVSLSKWESIYQKPFLSKREDRTPEEIQGYIRAMILTPGITDEILARMSTENINAIKDYIESPQSATTFNEMHESKGRGETITSELIYYWMVAFNIPFECEYWHLNRLFSLIRICNIKQEKPKKMSKSAIARQHHELNEQRKAQLGTRG